MKRPADSIITLLLVLALAVLIPAGISGAEPFAPDTEKSLDFARKLMADGDAPRARGELKRFLFFHPDDPSAGEARRLLQTLPPEKGSEDSLSDRASGPASALVRLYQNRLRTFRGDGICPSYPNCSDYCLQAIAKHGAWLGTFMQVDRFFREFTTAGSPPYVWRGGNKLHYDPVEMNDYWLTEGKGNR